MGEPFVWPVVDAFHDRDAELSVLERWWASERSEPINLYGRRRVGKSWLFRRFAHGKPATLLVASKSSEGAQLRGFAQRLEPWLGLRPSIEDVPALFRILFRVAKGRKSLAVIDEFPWLLPGTERGDAELLSAIAAVIEEERDSSALKLILCGSYVQQMEAMSSERSPLHGRLRPMHLRPMPFGEAALFMPDLEPVQRLERFSIAGGMPRYLSELGTGTVRDAVSARVLDRDGPLWDEPRVVLEQELRDSRSYFAIASALSGGPRDFADVVTAAALPSTTVTKYLHTLVGLRIVSRTTPIASAPTSRKGRWSLDDPFFRFWFRFVFPYQDELENGLSALDLFDAEVAPRLGDHAAPEFERWARRWVRQTWGRYASTVGPWWGNSRNELRRTGARSTEEIDIVGMSKGRVTLVGEAKWRNKASDANVVNDLENYKVPAMRQAGMTFAANYTTVVLSKGGYTPSLVKAAHESDGRIVLVDVCDALGGGSGGIDPTAH
jgi:AAA+ ATPase superfamily predicted ATPase